MNPSTHTPQPGLRAVEARRQHAAAFALFALLSAVHTWPLVTAPGKLSRHDNADALLNEWIVGWIAHQLPRHPLQLYDGNIFYPDRATLAYSEPLVVPGLMGAPLAWLGAPPVLVYNVLVLIGLSLTAWTAYLLVWRWTGDAVAGLIGGTILAFNAHTLTRLPQLQALHGEFLPLALLAFDTLLSSEGRSTVRAALLLALAVVLQGLTSYYGLVFVVVALAAGWLVRLEDWRSGAFRTTVPLVALAAAAALAVLVPMLAPYQRLGRIRPLDEVALYSATWRSYLMTPARVHYGTWSSSFFSGDTALFPGIAALALAAVAIASGTAVRNRRARMALAFCVAGLALSFGPRMPGYAALYGLAWPLQGVRNAARFGVLAIDGIALLAAFGVAAMRSRYRDARGMPAAAIALLVAVNIDALAAPIEYVRAEAPSSLHAQLRDTNAMVAEFPFYPPDRMMRQAAYLPHAMLHWRPMVNGYSGVVPASYLEVSPDLTAFPAARAIAALRRLGVTHVFVHDRALRDWTDNETADAVRTSPDLERMDTDGDLTLYHVR